MRVYQPPLTRASVGVLAAALLVPSVAPLVAQAVYRPFTSPVGVGVLAWRMMPPLAVRALLCYLAFRLAGKPRREDTTQPITLWPAAGLISILIVASFDYVSSLPLPYLRAIRPDWFESLPWFYPTRGFAIPLWLFWTIAGTAMEEFLYRAYSPLALEGMRVPVYGCVLAPAVFFGLQHVYTGWPFGVKCFLLGCVSGYAVLKTRNIWPALAPHLFYNMKVTIRMFMA